MNKQEKMRFEFAKVAMEALILKAPYAVGTELELEEHIDKVVRGAWSYANAMMEAQ